MTFSAVRESAPEGYRLQGAAKPSPLERTTSMASTLPSRPRGTLQEQVNDLRAMLHALCAEVQRATEGRAGSRPVLILIPGGKP